MVIGSNEGYRVYVGISFVLEETLFRCGRVYTPLLINFLLKIFQNMRGVYCCYYENYVLKNLYMTLYFKSLNQKPHPRVKLSVSPNNFRNPSCP